MIDKTSFSKLFEKIFENRPTDGSTKPPLKATSCRLTVNIRQIDCKPECSSTELAPLSMLLSLGFLRGFERVVRLVCGASEKIFGAGAVEFQKIH